MCSGYINIDFIVINCYILVTHYVSFLGSAMKYYDEYYEARQHLNLSQLAYDVVQLDKYAMQGKPSFAKAINHIFEMYRDTADAAIDLSCGRYVDALNDALSAVPESPEKQAIIQTLRDAYRKQLIQTAKSYPRGRSFKVQLYRENFAFVSEWHAASEWRDTKEAYDHTAGKFIKAVIEEYARKPLAERESILFRDFIDLANDCIRTEKTMLITLKNNYRYEIRPFCVCRDSGNNFNYLVGYAKLAGAEPDTECLVSYRISNIKAFKKTGKSGHLTESRKKDADRRLQTVGVQFLLQESETIQIKLTPHGSGMYDRQAHLRPSFDSRQQNEDGSWLYEFSCTPMQIYFYFFKFGADAEVLSPADLRERFAKQYNDAFALYSVNTR